MLYGIASKAEYTFDDEQGDTYKGLEIIFEAEDIENAKGYLTLFLDPENQIFDYQFVKVLNEEGQELLFYIQHAWKPHPQWFRVNPPVDEIKEYVKEVMAERELLYRPNMHKLIQKHIKAQAKATKAKK